MTVRGAAFLGAGSMVGAGIFALRGEAGAVAGSAVWLSLLVAGTVALSQVHAMAKLGARYPSSGGIVTFLIRGHGRGRVTAVTSWLLYFAALIVTAMVAVSFGQYGSALFFGGYAPWRTVLTTAVVLVVAAVDVAGARFVDRVWTQIVVVLFSVFAVFVAVALARLDVRLLAPATSPSAADVLRYPAVGNTGHVMMAIAALLATSSSVNATIHAATGSTATLAHAGLFPPVFGRRARVGGTRGLVISVVLVLLLVNLVDLTAIASLGSVVALVIFVVTALAAFRLRTEIGARTWLLVTGVALTALVLAVFAVWTLRTAPRTFTAMVGVLVLAVVLDLVWRRRQWLHDKEI